MKTIIIGYADAAARGKAQLLAGTETPVADQVKLVSEIKSKRSYPQGMVRVELCEVISRNVGILVQSDTPAPTESKPVKPKK